jgi:hypothetical protein
VGALLECLEQGRHLCPFALSFGYGHFCRCPLNNYVRGLNYTNALQR